MGSKAISSTYYMHMEAPFLRCASSDDLESFKVDLSAEDTRFEPEFHLCDQDIPGRFNSGTYIYLGAK